MNPFFLVQRAGLIEKLIIVLFGESNSGGIAPNSSATVSELAQRNIKILNNETLQFEFLDVGTNNLLGHHGLENEMFSHHGMELQIANLYDEGFFGNTEVFIVKAGQGGTTVADWAVGNQYLRPGSTPVDCWQTFLDRVNAAKNIVFPNGNANIKFMLSIGINDGYVGTNSATYKVGLKELINRVKNNISVSNFDLRLMKFDFVTSFVGNAYATQILEIPNEISGVSVFDTVGCSVLPDGNHLDYSGMKTATGKFLQ